MGAGPRVLVGRIYQEGNSFNPQPTRIADFVIERGQESLEAQAASSSILSGILQRLSRAGAIPIPSISAMARPGGPIEHSCFEDLSNEIVAAARVNEIDAIALELHGAMLTDKIDDPEGHLLERLRAIVGPRIPIAVGLDLHAHVTPAMLASGALCVACRTNPHRDFPETGEKVASLLLRTLFGTIAPVTASAHVPMLLPGSLETTDGPLARLHARARAWKRGEPDLLAISICNTMTFLDAPESGQAIIVIADNNERAAMMAASDLASSMWNMRDLFTSSLPSIDEALDVVLKHPQRRPFVLGDQGDRVIAGAPGDSVAILRRLIERKLDLRAAVPVTDPLAVSRAKAAGLGALVTVNVGGHLTPGAASLALTGRVEHVSDGTFTLRGPYMAGQASSLGECVVLLVGSIRVLLTSQAALTQDPAAFTSQHIDIATQDLVVSKSGHHFKLSFGDLATPLVVGSPGLSLYRRHTLPFKRKRPIWPEDDVVFNEPRILLFRQGSPAGTPLPATADGRSGP